MLKRLFDWLTGRGRVLVRADWGCPECGERRMDWLPWINDGEAVQCSRCGTVYAP